MSKTLPLEGAPPLPDPDIQLRQFSELLSGSVDPRALASVSARARELGLDFLNEELVIIAALDHPDKVQDFLNTQIYYNYDHPTVDHPAVLLGETARSPRMVLQTGRAHCFEGGCFAYAVNYLHGHDPKWLLLEASQDSDHNLILYCDPATGRYGVNAHSGYPRLVGQPARFDTIRAIAEHYFPYYISDHTLDPEDTTLIGYSDPIDLVDKFGSDWVASDKPLWDIYYLYVDDTVRVHYLFDDSDGTHLYPLVQALKRGWISVDNSGRAAVAVDRLPEPASELWDEFWGLYDPAGVRARGRARNVEMRFFSLTGTTPLDLEANAEEVQDFLNHGYRIEQVLHR